MPKAVDLVVIQNLRCTRRHWSAQANNDIHSVRNTNPVLPWTETPHSSNRSHPPSVGCSVMRILPSCHAQSHCLGTQPSRGSYKATPSFLRLPCRSFTPPCPSCPCPIPQPLYPLLIQPALRTYPTQQTIPPMVEGTLCIMSKRTRVQELTRTNV